MKCASVPLKPREFSALNVRLTFVLTEISFITLWTFTHKLSDMSNLTRCIIQARIASTGIN